LLCETCDICCGEMSTQCLHTSICQDTYVDPAPDPVVCPKRAAEPGDSPIPVRRKLTWSDRSTSTATTAVQSPGAPQACVTFPTQHPFSFWPRQEMRMPSRPRPPSRCSASHLIYATFAIIAYVQQTCLS
jgi:hypothetical protein